VILTIPDNSVHKKFLKRPATENMGDVPGVDRPDIVLLNIFKA
jgi:hypothetical protein